MAIHGRLVVCCQSAHAYLYCGKLVAKTIGHASKPPSPISKLEVNGPACHHVFCGQDHGQICVANLGFLCDTNRFI